MSECARASKGFVGHIDNTYISQQSRRWLKVLGRILSIYAHFNSMTRVGSVCFELCTQRTHIDSGTMVELRLSLSYHPVDEIDAMNKLCNTVFDLSRD